MNPVIFCLLVVFSLNYSLAFPTENANPTLARTVPELNQPRDNSILISNPNTAHQSEPSIVSRHDKVLADEREQNENSILRRFRRCADWFRRIRSRYSGPNGINLFGSNGLFSSLNDGYRYSNRYNDLNTYHRNQPSHDDNYNNYENSNYQPANDNYESNRINNSPSSTYNVPSSSPPSVFVEASSFVTPPNREEAPAVSSSAPVEHANEDWTYSPNADN